MKPKHKRPLRKYLELAGGTALVYTLWAGRHVIGDALVQIRQANIGFVALCFFIAWCNFLWSGLGYKLLAKKALLRHVILVHIAASGPGRVIPGGAGHFSFGVLYLKKLRYTLQQAVAVATVNNLLGFLVNILLVLPVLILRPEVLPTITLGVFHLYITAIVVCVCILGFYVYNKNMSVKKQANKTSAAIKQQSLQLIKSPKTLTALVSTMLAQIVTHCLVLVFAGHALQLSIDPFYAFVAISTGVAAGSLLPTPGGVGGVEAGIIASFVSFGFSAQEATSVALLYRTATYIQPLLPGALSYLYLRKKDLI